MTTNEEEKVLFHQDNAMCHKSIVMRAKLHELHFKLIPHLTYSPDLNPSGSLETFFIGSNEEVISETDAYFEATDKSFYKNGTELVEKPWNQCISLEEDYVDEQSRILPKSCCFISLALDLYKKTKKKTS